MVRRVVTAIVLGIAIAGVACGAATAALPIDKGISYGPSPGEKGTVFPSTKAGSTIIVLVHGGGWRLQTNETEFGGTAKGLQLRGFTVFDINYDQDSPTTRAFPLEVVEVQAAVEWIVANAATYKGNPANVVLLGGSAGGQLASMAADILDSAAPGTVRGVISLSAPYDFQSLVQMAIRKEIRDLSYIKSIGQALGCLSNLQTCSSSFEAEWSPDQHLPEAGCPSWLLASSEEVPTDVVQAQEMQAHLQAHVCPLTFKVVPKGHGFSIWTEVSTQIYEFLHAN